MLCGVTRSGKQTSDYVQAENGRYQYSVLSEQLENTITHNLRDKAVIIERAVKKHDYALAKS